MTQVQSRPADIFAVSASDLGDLQELVAECQRQNIEVVLVLAPYLAQYQPKLQNLDAFIEQITQTLFDEQLKFTFINGSDQITDAARFADHVHLNREGQADFSRWLFRQPAFD